MAEVLTPDLCVIGAGRGGQAVADQALALGASVVIVERGRAGRSGLYAGAVASRALFEAARHAHAMRASAAFGIAPAEPEVDFARLRNHIRDIIAGLAPTVAGERLIARGARLITAQGRFIDHGTLGAGDTLVRARRFVIATGATPVLPPIAGLEGVEHFTSDTILDNVRRMTHLVIVGAGATGAELGQAYRRLGADVTIIETGMPLADEDPELADVVLRRLQEDGVLIRSGTSVPRVTPREGGGAVVTISAGGAEETISASHLLIATGRSPNLELDLDRAGIRRSRTDPTRLDLSAGLRTSNPKVYAIGDAVGGRQSKELAAYQARLVVRRALLGTPTRYRPELVPWALYTDPGIAVVGLTEAAARRRHRDRFRIGRWPFAGNDRARTRRDTAGLCKIITTPSGRILGAAIAGPDAGELIALFSFALANGLSLMHLKRFIAPYPTLAEIAQRVAGEVLDQPPASRWQALLRRLSGMLP